MAWLNRAVVSGRIIPYLVAMMLAIMLGAALIVHFLSPASKQVVEWPPPGLSRLRGTGARLIASLHHPCSASLPRRGRGRNSWTSLAAPGNRNDLDDRGFGHESNVQGDPE